MPLELSSNHFPCALSSHHFPCGGLTLAQELTPQGYALLQNA